MADEDVSEFFDPADFSVAASFTLADGRILATHVIYDAPYLSALQSAQMGGVEAAQPKLECAEAAVDGVVEGDTVQLKGKTFRIRDVQPDGTGVVVMLLNEVTA